MMRQPILLFIFFLLHQLGHAQVNPSNFFDIEDGELKELLHYDGECFPLISAHRGGRYIEGYPENAIETFDYILQQIPAIIECDIVQSLDSVLYIMHDKSLDRTTTGTGLVSSKRWDYVEELRLLDDFGDATSYEVPTLEEVLRWAKGKTVLALDV